MGAGRTHTEPVIVTPMETGIKRLNAHHASTNAIRERVRTVLNTYNLLVCMFSKILCMVTKELKQTRAGEIAHRLITFNALAQDPALTWQLLTACNSSSSGFHTLFWLPRVQNTCDTLKSRESTHKHKIQIKKYKKLIK